MSHVTITIVTRTGRVDITETSRGLNDNVAVPLGTAVVRAIGAVRPEFDEVAIMVKQIHHELRDAGLLPKDSG